MKEDIRSIHREAILLYKSALKAKEEGQTRTFKMQARQAFKLEKAAAEKTRKHPDAEPTRAVLHLSAATMATQLELYKEASELIHAALSGKPHMEMRTELTDLLGKVSVHLNQQLQSKGKLIHIALLDMYDGHPNQGMRCLREIIFNWSVTAKVTVRLREFDVRGKTALPGLDHDIYISSGGPGNPLASANEDWDIAWRHWLYKVHTSNETHHKKKHVFFIGHSYQLACLYFKLADVTKRLSTAFGLFPMHLTQDGIHDPLFHRLPNPIFVVDTRDFQVVNPEQNVLKRYNACVLCIEKERPHVPYERAITGIRFNEFMSGTQFHPEADLTGLLYYLLQDRIREQILSTHGEEKYNNMLSNLEEHQKLGQTHGGILVNFLNQAAGKLEKGGMRLIRFRPFRKMYDLEFDRETMNDVRY